jgi:hypothetical protein
LAACNGILELRDAALAAAEAMGLSYEVLGLFSAGLTLLLAIVRALWVYYRGTPCVVDRIDPLDYWRSFYNDILKFLNFNVDLISHCFFLLNLYLNLRFLFNFELVITGLWSGWWWGWWSSSSPFTGGRWCGSPPSATPSSPWVAASPTDSAASPPRAYRYLYFLLLCFNLCGEILRLLFLKS